MAIHPLLCNRPLLLLIAEWLDDVNDKLHLASMARSFRNAHTPANTVLYRSLDLSPALGPSAGHPSEAFRLLSRTIQSNSHLASLVLRIKMGHWRMPGFIQLIQACTSLHHVHLDLRCREPSSLPPSSIWGRTVLNLSPRVQSLSVQQNLLAERSPFSLLNGSLAAPGIHTLSIRASPATISYLLSDFRPHLHNLTLYAADLAPLTQQAVTSLLQPAADLANFTIIAVRFDEFTRIPLDHLVKRYVVKHADVQDIVTMFEQLVDPFCRPDLQCLPVILNIEGGHVYRFADSGDIDKLTERCSRAKTACLSRAAWRGPARQFDRLLERLLKVIGKNVALQRERESIKWEIRQAGTSVALVERT